jgi:hypothetical protein
VPALDALLAETVDRQFAALGEALVADWSPSDDAKRLSATVAIALAFETWQRMADMGLDDAAAAELMTDMAVCAANIGPLPAHRPVRPRPGRGESAGRAQRQTRG